MEKFSLGFKKTRRAKKATVGKNNLIEHAKDKSINVGGETDNDEIIVKQKENIEGRKTIKQEVQIDLEEVNSDNEEDGVAENIEIKVEHNKGPTEDYERTSEFGAAMLCEMDYTPDKEKSKKQPEPKPKNKNDSSSGADKSVSENQKKKKITNGIGEEPNVKNNPFAKMPTGNYMGYYGKTIRSSHGQRVKLLEFMRTHSDLASGRLNCPEGFRRKRELLQQLADSLNRMGDGAFKTPDKWLKTWQDWKSDVKAKARKIKYASRCGGPVPASLTQVEQEVLDLVGPVCVEGLDVPDPLQFQQMRDRERERERSRSPLGTSSIPSRPARQFEYEIVENEQSQQQSPGPSNRTHESARLGTTGHTRVDPMVEAMRRQADAVERQATAMERQADAAERRAATADLQLAAAQQRAAAATQHAEAVDRFVDGFASLTAALQQLGETIASRDRYVM